MGANDNFSKAMLNYSKKTRRKLKAVADETVLELFTEMVNKTPIDQDGSDHAGTAKANWRVTKSAPADVVVDTPDPNGSKTIADGVSSLRGSGKLAEHYWIVNSIEYIMDLEMGLYPKNSDSWKTTPQGYSTMAPAGMARVTLEDAPQIFKEVADRIDRTVR